ncbi:MAG: cell division protein ZapA [Alphaproteobacteria bacterium]|jgi:cell division protein ZapA|nr:cell division protein ZapA [Alphaproteobacteria bacterium]
MPNINVSINGRSFSVSCQPGEESRVQDLANYVDEKTRIVTRAGTGISEAQVLMLSCLLLADEVKSGKTNSLNEDEIMARIEKISAKVKLLSNK